MNGMMNGTWNVADTSGPALWIINCIPEIRLLTRDAYLTLDQSTRTTTKTLSYLW